MTMHAIRFVALGDSLTEGIGDPLPGGGWRGWARLLADGLGGVVDYHNLAESGALTRDLWERQLPAAAALEPHFATVVIGANDTLRASYDIHAITTRLDAVLGTLSASGTVPLTACLPDPGRMLGLPGALARPLARRMHSLNTVVHALSHRHGAVHVHAADRPWVHDARMWSHDRLHPAERGHRALAREFHSALADHGVPLGPPPSPDPSSPAPGRGARAWWMATRGTRWILKRSTDLLPDLLRLALTEHRHGSPTLLDHRAAHDTALALATTTTEQPAA